MWSYVEVKRNAKPYGYTRGQVTVRAVAGYDDRRGYFSLTGTVYGPRGAYLAGGQIEELESFSVYAPVRMVHLANADGVPMHAESNARYFAGLTKWAGCRTDLLARHLQTDEEEAELIAVDLASGMEWEAVLDKYRLPQLWVAHADHARWAIEKGNPLDGLDN